MAPAVLLSAVLFALCASANSQTATLKFSNEFPAEFDNVTITCDSSAIANPSDLSELKFYATNNAGYTFTLTRNCTSNVKTESNTGFGASIYSIEGADQKIYLQWTNFSVDYRALLFQCSISSCSTSQTVQSNTANITVLQSPQTPILNWTTIRFNENIESNLTFNCHGFVGYPGGNLELQHINSVTNEIRSLANFTTDAQGNANGTYVLSITANRTAEFKDYVLCESYNVLNSEVPHKYAIGDSFYVSYPPNTIKFWYSTEDSLVQETKGSLVIDRKSPISNEKLKCGYDEASPSASIEFTQVSGPNSTLQIQYLSKSYTYVIDYYGSDEFTLVFNCTVAYESGADPNIKKVLSELATVNVRAMATMLNVSYMLLLSALAALWKI